MFSGPYYFAEQLGFRKIIDTTFLIATIIHSKPDPVELRIFFRALRRVQRDPSATRITARPNSPSASIR